MTFTDSLLILSLLSSTEEVASLVVEEVRPEVVVDSVGTEAAEASTEEVRREEEEEEDSAVEEAASKLLIFGLSREQMGCMYHLLFLHCDFPMQNCRFSRSRS